MHLLIPISIFGAKIQIHLYYENELCVSEANYVYILSGLKFLKMPKMLNLASFRKLEACGQTVLPDRSILIGQKLVENAKIQMRHFE